jgi:hypothetical protein
VLIFAVEYYISLLVLVICNSLLLSLEHFNLVFNREGCLNIKVVDNHYELF